MPAREPFKRNSLRGIKNEEHYIKKMEDIIIAEGERLLNSLKINYCIISQRYISKFIEKHPEFKKTVWQQIRIQRLYDTKIINTFQHKLLIMMKQVCNKNNLYILKKDAFDKRYYVLNCKRIVEKCLMDDCPSAEACPYYYKNVEGKHAKYQRWVEEYKKTKVNKNE